MRALNPNQVPVAVTLAPRPLGMLKKTFLGSQTVLACGLLTETILRTCLQTLGWWCAQVSCSNLPQAFGVGRAFLKRTLQTGRGGLCL